MKFKNLLSYTLAATLLGLSSTASAQFSNGPFDWMDSNDDYNRYNYQDGRGYGRDRWRQYDEWEPNYWRYRYFDNDSNDYFDDEFGSDSFGGGRGKSNFGMNMDFDTDTRFDGDYDNRYSRDGRRYGNDYYQPSRRNNARRSYGNDSYRDSRRSNNRYYGNSRRMSETPEYQRQRETRRAEQPVECR